MGAADGSDDEEERRYDDGGEPSGASGPEGPDVVEEDEELSAEESEELLEEIERKRRLAGWPAVVVALVGIIFSAFQMFIAAQSTTARVSIPFTGEEVQLFALQQLQANAIHVGFALVLAFLLFPTSTGDGFVSRRVGSLFERLRSVVGDGTGGRAVDRVRAAGRWALLDADRRRVTPVDYLFVFLSLLTPYYMLTEFDEIRSMRIFGIGSGRPLHQVYPLSRPFAEVLHALGVPIGEWSYAFVIGVIGVLLVLEATRRALGTFLMALVASFIVYARLGYLIPQDILYVRIFSIPPLAWESIVRDLWYTTQGIFGIPVTVSVRFIYIFILFGAFLEMSGAGQWFIDFAYSLTGGRQGGPAKSSVVASGFMGMLSGSSIANTVTTGAFTIPLMKRSGYSPEFAGAVESSASSGGQILPPVMGAAAFLIVEFTGTPYSEVIVAATLPAIAFFFGMWVMVHLEAGRHGIGGVDAELLESVKGLLSRGWFYLFPVILLLYFLVGLRLSVGRAGWYTIVVIVALVAFIAAYNERTRVPLVATIVLAYVASAATRLVGGVGVIGFLAGRGGAGMPLGEAAAAAVTPMGTVTVLVSFAVLLFAPRGPAPMLELDPAVDRAAGRVAERAGRPEVADNKAYRFASFVVKSMDAGARTATTVVIAVAAAGVIPGIISVSGLGPNLTSLILTVSGQSLVVMLLLAGISAIILGLGMPTTVMYILLIAMLGPALETLGVMLLAAHLFVLYFGLMADVTPPVAVAAYAAAGIAKADEFSTGVTAFLLSLNKIMVPFAFIFAPGILLLRDGREGPTVIGLSDVLDLGFFLPEVLVPILGMFIGVYALGITIIGYFRGEVSRGSRVGFGVAAFLLMVPAMLLVPLETALGADVYNVTVDVLMRAVGFAAFVVLMAVNRTSDDAERVDAAPAVE